MKNETFEVILSSPYLRHKVILFNNFESAKRCFEGLKHKLAGQVAWSLVLTINNQAVRRAKGQNFIMDEGSKYI